MNIRYRYIEKSDYIIKEELINLNKFIAKGRLLSDDVKNKFESKICNYLNEKYGIALSSGTNALYLALKALTLKKKDEVLVPCLSWMSSFTAVNLAGAKPIGVDIDQNLQMDLNKIKYSINKNTKAIIFVHFGGLFKDLTFLKNFCKKKNIFLIEDCAQNFGTRLGSNYPGNFGDFASFSMNPMKVYSSLGEAGFLTCKKNKYYKQVNILKYAGIKNKEKVIIPELNHKIDNLQCYVLSQKLKKLNQLIQKRINIAKLYDTHLSKKIIKPIFLKNFSHNYYSYIIQFKHRDLLKEHLEKNKIETKIQHQNILSDHDPFKFKNSKIKFKMGNYLKKRILSLPIDENLTKKQIVYIIKIINNFVNKSF